jgi:hypothetical protein
MSFTRNRTHSFNLAQWRSVEDYQAMRKNVAALPYMEQALTLAKFESGMYEVVETFDHLPTHA